MIRILGLELRRSAALGALLALLVVGVAMLYGAGSRWSPSWMALAMTQREYLILLWPVALAAGAWQGRREKKSQVGELFTSTPRPAPQRMIPTAGAMALAVVGAYLAVAAAGVPALIDTAGYLPAEVFVVAAVGALSLVAAVWVGLAAGRAVPALWVGPALAVAGLGLLLGVRMLFAKEQPWLGMIFSPMDGMSMFTDYQTIDNRVSAASAIWLLGLAGAALLLLVAGSWRVRVAALLPVALGAALAIAVIPRGSAFVEHPIDPVAQEQVCTDDLPRVCVSRVHEAGLPHATEVGREVLAALAKLPDAPTSVEEDTSTYVPMKLAPQRDGVVQMDVELDGKGRLDNELLTKVNMLGMAAANDRHCQTGGWLSGRAVAFWLLGMEPVSEPELDPMIFGEYPAEDAEIRKQWQILRDLPEQEAAARVAATRTAAEECKDITGMLEKATR